MKGFIDWLFSNTDTAAKLTIEFITAVIATVVAYYIGYKEGEKRK